jgi:aspartate/methionine/tyrosine aminotransferase
MLLMPDGNPAGTIERIMLLAMWANQLTQEGTINGEPPVIFAGMGNPTFPINDVAAKAALDYWTEQLLISQQARHLLSDKLTSDATREQIIQLNSAVNDGDPQGDQPNREKMATALSAWYETEIKPQHILFTVGGVAGLHDMFNFINKKFPDGRIVTQFPHYSLYTGSRNSNRLYPIDVMRQKGYRLTAAIIEKAIKNANALGEQDGGKVSAFLLCDPNNPLGTLLHKDEVAAIAEVLKKYPEIYILLDEAYAEMCMQPHQHNSLLKIAPDLKHRIILMRSATKALSAAGERMAVTVAFDPAVMAGLKQENIDINGHAPHSLQQAFAEAMLRLDSLEVQNIVSHYQPQVEYVIKRLQQMGAAMPDPEYKVEGTFYVLADLSDLLGMKLASEAARALNKNGEITTDEDLAYDLLFKDRIMVAPISYFGSSAHSGYLRITCSTGDEGSLVILMNKLEHRLVAARKYKQEQLITKINEIINAHQTDPAFPAQEFNARLKNIVNDEQKAAPSEEAKILKEKNQQLALLRAEIRRSTPSESDLASTMIKKAFCRHKVRKAIKKRWQDKINQQWYEFVPTIFASKELQQEPMKWSANQRLNFRPWCDFLASNQQLLEAEVKHDADTQQPPSHAVKNKPNN